MAVRNEGDLATLQRGGEMAWLLVVVVGGDVARVGELRSGDWGCGGSDCGEGKGKGMLPGTRLIRALWGDKCGLYTGYE